MKFTIRKKLLFVSLTVLAIPWIGFDYVRELERYLRDSLEDSLMDFARAMSAPLQERPELFPEQSAVAENTLYVHTLEHPVQLDGYIHDWLSYLDWSVNVTENGLGYRLLISRYQQYYYLLLQVHDNKLIYQHPDKPDALDNDHVEVVFTDPYDELTHIYFSPSAPGSIRPFRHHTHVDEYGIEVVSTQYLTNIAAEWQADTDGYNLEAAIPISLVGDRFGLVVHDVDDHALRDTGSSLGTAGVDTRRQPGRLVSSSPAIKDLVRGHDRSGDRRIWVLDAFGRVLANSGSLESPDTFAAGRSIYALLLPPITRRFKDDLAGASRLQSEEVLQAQAGKTVTRWRASPDGKAIILSAATPVRIQDEIRGVVVVEQTTSGIQLQQRKAISDLLNRTLLVFLFVTAILLFYATRLSIRIRQLGKEANRSIDEHGRVIAPFTGNSANDEIGELSRSYAAMIERLRQYNDYLEKMAGRLSHELRTPITVVQTSLEHLQADSSSDEYLQRAREGVDRLQMLVKRLSEAARLEQALQSSNRELMNINQLLENCIKGYTLASKGKHFDLVLPDNTISHPVTPDLFVQMLDKMVANAMDFSLAGSAVKVALVDGNVEWHISISNEGPLLPDHMGEQLFNSMVSIRSDCNDTQPHLGLGLYIARLIAEFHGGVIRAADLPDKSGVCFDITFQKRP